MQRRQLLTTLGSIAGSGLLTGMAGCTGSADTAPAPAGDEDDGDETPTTGDEPTPTATATGDPASGAPDVSIGEPTLGYDESGYGTDVYAAVKLTNEGDAVSGPVSVTADWFDADGNYLDDSRNGIASLNPGETWSARVYALLIDEEKIDDVEMSGEYGREALTVPDGVELVSSQLLSGESVKVRGEVANNMDRAIDYVAFYGKVYNDAGEVLGQGWTNESDVPAGGAWRADPEWRGRERAAEAVDHEVVLEANVY